MEPVNCFVAMFDIIGFRNLRKKIGTAGLYRRFARGVLPSIHHAAAGRGKLAQIDGKNIYIPEINELSVKFQNISDTVIFYTSNDSFASFLSILNSSFMLLQFGFAGGKDPFRGAIGWGDLIASGSILIGTAIEDAYEGEAGQAWAGGMTTPKCKEFLDREGYVRQYQDELNRAASNESDETKHQKILSAAKRMTIYQVPTQANPKDGPTRYSQLETYAIDWTLNMYDGAGAAAFEQSQEAHAQRLAKNTIAFEKWARTYNR